jgi:hypothetical protein
VEKGALVMAIEDYFDTQFSALKASGAGDGMGGQETSYTVDFTFYGVTDLIQGYRSTVAAQFKEKATHILMCPISTALKPKHLIDDGVSRWRVLNVDNPMSRDHHLEAILEYIGASPEE